MNTLSPTPSATTSPTSSDVPLAATRKPQVHGLFDKATWTVTYVVHDGPGSACGLLSV